MAEAVFEIVLENLNSFIQKELGLFLGFDQDMKRLVSLFTTINSSLEDAAEKQFSERAIKDWLQKLKDAAYVLEDILDECAYEALRLEYQQDNHDLQDTIQCSCLSSFYPKHIVFRYKIARKMKRISERLDKIAEERIKFHLPERVPDRRNGVSEWRQTTSSITEPQVYGRQEDTNKIVDFLIGDASHFEDLSVYPIIGLGGVGKTTLAQLIFKHEKVVNHFKLRIWVCVSEDFSLKRIIKSIIEAISGFACEDLNLEPLQKRLQDLLQRKTYLLVLDDIWNDEQENWQRLKSLLSCGAKGASILVTTRLSKVAAIMGTVPPYELSKLSDNDCWELFKHRAFGPNEVEPVELVAIGQEIVKKCGGVPLAAKAIGGILRFKRKKNEWLNVKESNLSELSHNENSIMPALRLSYLHLPIKLRQCFAYCAIFPKDEIIRKQYLIELWMANGFISSNERLDAEDVGDTVWNELYWRSFFQDIEMDEFGQVTCFKMHDLVHDLAQSVAEDVCCITDDSGITTLPERIHHISDHTKQGINSTQLYKVESLRSYIYCHYSGVFKCYSLRVLGFTGSKILSSSIGDLKCLRYLNLSDGGFETLPESLCKLWNLQILILDHCQHLLKLPNSLIRLKALQHLSLKDCNKLSSLPPQIGKLTSLRILSKYFVGNERGFHLAELGPLKLKGDLEIKHLGKVKSVKDAKEANMSSKQLNKLWLLWDNNEESELQDNVEEILQVLQPDTQQLQYLRVEGYKGVNFSQWMTSTPSLKYLTRLELKYCKSSLHLPALGKLPSLKTLWIFDMIRVKYLFEESCDGGIVFMALEDLSLMYMPSLISLSREDGEIMFPHLSKFTVFECRKFSRLSREDGKNKFLCLSRLDIGQCPKLLGLPSLPSINDLIIEGKCKKDLLSSIHKLSSLESLWIEGNEELTCFPDGMLQNLTSLKKLDLHRLSKLEVLQTEMINLNSMQELFIWNCNNIKLWLQGLHSLKKLNVLDCHKFIVSAGFQCLTCLEELSIERCKEVEGLHEALQHMISLKELTLSSLPNLESLPDCFGNLPLLHRLSIYGCSELRCLPMSLSLSNLQHLNIQCCPELGKRCEKETGEDWPKIAHISHIIVRRS